MSKKVTASWAKATMNDNNEIIKFKLKNCLKEIKKSAKSRKDYCSFEVSFLENEIVEELENRGFEVVFHQARYTSFPIPYTFHAHYIVKW